MPLPYLIKMLKTEIQSLLTSIQHCYCDSELTEDDDGVLRSMFEHAICYNRVLEYPGMCAGHVVDKIAEFCKLAQDMLPVPPDHQCVRPQFELIKRTLPVRAFMLPHDAGTQSVNIHREVLLHVISVVQAAINDRSARAVTAEMTLAQREETRYVIGLAESTAINVENLLKARSCEDHTPALSYADLDKFFGETFGFVSSLQANGVALVNG